MPKGLSGLFRAILKDMVSAIKHPLHLYLQTDQSQSFLQDLVFLGGRTMHSLKQLLLQLAKNL